MRNDRDNARGDKTGRAATHPVAAPPVYTAEERKTVRDGLRVLARIIARARLPPQVGAVRANGRGQELGTPRQSVPRATTATGCRGVSDSLPWPLTFILAIINDGH